MVNTKILIVEDENIEALDIKSALESFGYSIPHIASSGEDAVEKALELMPDLILMDIVLKGEKNGVDAASRIKELDIPIIFLTAHSEESVVKQALLTEAYGYILKPYDKKELQFTVELALYKKKMEKKLKNSEKRFKTLYNEAPLPYQSLSREGYFLEVNQSWLDTLGYSRDEVMGKHFSDFLAPAYVDQFKQNFPRFKAAGEIHGIEFEMKRKDGSIIHVSFEGKIGYDVEGNVKQTHCIFQDITERKKTEKALKESELKYRFLTEQMNDIVWTLNMELQTTYVSPSIENVLGFTPEERMKQQINEQITPESMFIVREFLKNELMLEVQGLADADRTINLELEYYHKDGSIRWLENVISGIRDDEGKLYGFHGVSRDITRRKKNEMDFRALHNRSEEALNLSKMAYWEYDIPSNTFIFNERFYKLHGINFDDYRMSVELFTQRHVHPDFQEQLTHTIKQAINSSDSLFQVKIEGKLIKSSGKTFWVRTWVKKDEKSHTSKLYGVNQDINDIKMVEEALRKSEETFRSLIYNSTDLIRILDGKGRIIFDSPSSERILGYSEGYFIGKNPLDFIHPEDLEKVAHDLKEVYEKRNQGIPTEFQILKADGEYLPVESLSQNMMNVPGIDGIVVTTHPIKQRKEMEKALCDSEEKYKTLFESDPNYMVLLGLDGVILDVNNATVNFSGLSKESLAGKRFTDLGLFPDEDAQAHIKNIYLAIKNENVESFQCKIINKTGGYSWIESQLVPLEKEGNIASLLVIATDITERKIATDQLKSSLLEKEVLLKEIHHRVKNNMQIISSLLNLQTHHVHDDRVAVDVLKESQNRVKSMAMIHEKLYQSKDFTNIKFDDYIERLISELFYSYDLGKDRVKPSIEVEKVKLNIETAVPCGLIISELVSNCLKHAFPSGDGELNLSLKLVDDKYELIISDNGIGFPKELDFKKTKSLGLQLVNSLVKQIDGQINLDKSHGTKFTIIFKELEYQDRM